MLNIYFFEYILYAVVVYLFSVCLYVADLNNDYKFSNIFLIVALSDSLNIIAKDTLHFTLADKSGRFLGDKRINLFENSLLHKENISLDNLFNLI